MGSARNSRRLCAALAQGQILVQQRKFIAKNLNVTKNKHFKVYPGENVLVRDRFPIGPTPPESRLAPWRESLVSARKRLVQTPDSTRREL